MIEYEIILTYSRCERGFEVACLLAYLDESVFAYSWRHINVELNETFLCFWYLYFGTLHFYVYFFLGGIDSRFYTCTSYIFLNLFVEMYKRGRVLCVVDDML
jgi:hypothetical protein